PGQGDSAAFRDLFDLGNELFGGLGRGDGFKGQVIADALDDLHDLTGTDGRGRGTVHDRPFDPGHELGDLRVGLRKVLEDVPTHFQVGGQTQVGQHQLGDCGLVEHVVDEEGRFLRVVGAQIGRAHV